MIVQIIVIVVIILLLLSTMLPQPPPPKTPQPPPHHHHHTTPPPKLSPPHYHYPEKRKGYSYLLSNLSLIYLFIFHYFTPCCTECRLLPGAARYLILDGNSEFHGFFRVFSPASNTLCIYIGPWSFNGVERFNCMSTSPAKRCGGDIVNLLSFAFNFQKWRLWGRTFIYIDRQIDEYYSTFSS